MDRTTIRFRDRKWFVCAEYSLNDEPTLRRLYWPILGGERVGVISEAEHNGSALYRQGDGRYRLMDVRSFGPVTVYVDPKANAVIEEEEAFPCPKVRKGIDTRYSCSQWQKYSKKEGWIAA